jgi:DNA repair protein RadC
MKKKSILNAYETKLFNDWIEDGNAFKNDKGVWLEQTTQYSKKFTYDELQTFFKREYLAEGYNGGGRVKTKEYFQIFKLENLDDKTELLLTEQELYRFINKWNLDNNTDYADWVEFNEYEYYAKITPVFSKNEYGGNVNNSFVESEINSVSTWENEEIATYLEVPVNEVAKHRDYYVEETQNAMLVNQVDGDYAKGGEVSLDKKYNFDDYGIKSYRELIDAGKFRSKFKSISNASDFDRIKFNRMRGREQVEYVRKLNKQKIQYNLRLNNVDGTFYTVKKEIFDYANIPETEEQNFYTQFDEPTGFIFEKGGMVGSEIEFNKYGETRTGTIYEDFKNNTYAVQSGTSKVLIDEDDILRTLEPKKETSFSFFDNGGGVGEFPPKGELTNKNNFLLKYEKKGGEYEFFVYKPITKEVSGYNQIKHVCLNKDCPQKMNYEQFINYLYAELYLDDTQYADGGIIEVVGKGNKGAFRKREYDGMTEKEVADFWLERGYTLSKSRSESKLKPYTFYIQKYADGGDVPHEDKMPNEITGNDNIKYIKVKTHNNPNGEIVTNYEGYWNGHIIDGFWVGNINELNRYIEDRILSINQYNRLKHLPIKELPKYADGGDVWQDINMEFLKVLQQYGFINSYSWGHNTYENKNKDIIVFSPKSNTIGKGWLTLQLSNNIEERLHLKPFTTSALIDLFNKYGLLPNVNKGELSYTLYNDGGDVPNQDKMFQLPLEMVIYVPSTQDVDKVISVDKMDKRVDEVKIYLANKFGGYTSADKLGGFVDSTGNLVNEDVVQVTSFSTKEAYAENKEELINQLAKWGEEWGQESIGFEFEGDLMYVPQKFKKGGETKKIGFKGLANKVASRYEGKKVAPKFQSEYGKTYSKEEAQEVGNKVAGKVYREQKSNKLAEGGRLKKYNHLKEYYEKYVNGGFVGGDIIKFKYDGKEFTRKVESVDDMGNALVNLMKTQKATINPADIFDIKKDFSEKDVIIKKIGLNENLAEYLVSVSPTFAVWFADAIVENEIEERQESKEVVLKAINEKSISKNTNYFNNNFGGAIREILDWLQHPSTPKQNLRDLTFSEALKKSRDWHQELTTSGGDLNFVEPDENSVLITYPPNEFGKTYYWAFIPKNYCDIESSRMGHCGRTGAGSLISLRSFFTNINNESVTDSHVTIAYNKDDGLFYQAKGKQNRKPVEKYFPYIFDLIVNLSNGKIKEEYKLKVADKLNDLRSQEKKSKAELEKIKKYFESKEARSDKAESLVEKANKLVSIREKLNEIEENIKMIDTESDFDFNGFGSEYQSSNDYGYEEFTTEQIKQLYQLKPEIFKDFAGEYMLYQAGVVSEKPNTIFTLEKPVEYVSDLLRLNRDFSDDFVRQVLTGETYDFIDSRYYYENAGNYVDELNKENYQSVIDKIIEITEYDKQVVEENGAGYYLNGADENFDSDSFDSILTAIGNALTSAVEGDYIKYYYDQIEGALIELGQIEKLDDTGLVISVDLSDKLTFSEISAYMKDLDSDNLEEVFFQAESNGDIELPSLSIDDRYEPYPDNWQVNFDINHYAKGGAVYPDLSMQKAQVVNDSIRIPEFELKQAKEVVVIEGVTNTKILGSDDANKIFRNIWGKDTIKAYEQCYVLYLNKANKVIGYYHHSAGGIDGTVMDIEMISGMAVKSLSKGVMIAHNHPSGNTTPSDSDKNITKQLYQALKLFNITLLDSIILTEDSYLSFANEGLL